MSYRNHKSLSQDRHGRGPAGVPARSNAGLKTVVFLCTANYYRSRFSEYLFNALAKRKGLPWRATSRGLRTWLAINEGPLSEFTAYRLTALGVPYDGERFPIPLAESDLEEADLVIAVKEEEHREMMLEQFPRWADRIRYWHVDDMDCATPAEALPILQSCIESLVEQLADAEQEARSQTMRAAA